MKINNESLFRAIGNINSDRIALAEKSQPKRRKSVTWQLFIPLAACFAVIIGMAVMLHLLAPVDLIDPIDPVSPADSGIPGTNEVLADYSELYAQNNDMVGFIRIGNTAINYPVLQAADNNYYLARDFDRELRRAGAIFADFRNRFDGTEISANTVLYGHNLTTGKRFSSLTRYWGWGDEYAALSFYRENPVINFDTLYERMEWKIFAVVLANTQEEHGHVGNFWNQHEFADAGEFDGFIAEIMNGSVLITDVDVAYGDRLLTLSTCFFPFGNTLDTRLLVFARQVREGESNEVDVSGARFNSELRYDFSPW